MNSSQSEKRSKAKNGWIKELGMIYNKNIPLNSYYNSRAPHPRIEGQLGRNVTTEGYNTVVVYIQLSKRIDFEMVKYFLNFHLCRWIQSNYDCDTKLGILFFYDKQEKLIIERSGKIDNFIDDTLGNIEPGNIRFFDKYKYGWIPGADDFIIFITDETGCKVNNETSSKLLKYKKRIVWVKLEKEKDVIIEKRKLPILENELTGSNSEYYLNDGYGNKRNSTLIKENLDDFYLKYDTSNPWINQGRQKSIEISGNTLTVDDGLGMSLFKNVGEKYSIPIDKVIELKNTLLRFNIFQIEKDYPSASMDGTSWELSVRFDGKKISSKGYNNYPARWSQIIDAIENCTKYKSLVNI